MNAHIEPIAGVLRVFADGKQFGDVYVWAATVRWLSSDTVEIMGVDKPPTMEVWRAIRALVYDDTSGIRRVVIKRHGQTKTLERRD